MCDLISCKHDTMSLCWVTSPLNLNEVAENLAFKCGTATHPATMVDGFGKSQQVSGDAFNVIVEDVKALCQGLQVNLIRELSNWFPTSTLMDALGVVYPQHWLQAHADDLFEAHFSVLKAHYCTERVIAEVIVPPILDMSTLNHQ